MTWNNLNVTSVYKKISDDPALTNVARPNTSATLTIRIIKSFIFRTERSLVLHDVNLVTTTVAQLKEIAKQGMLFSPWNHNYSEHESDVATQPGWKPYRNVVLGLSFFEWLLDHSILTTELLGRYAKGPWSKGFFYGSMFYMHSQWMLFSVHPADMSKLVTTTNVINLI